MRLALLLAFAIQRSSQFSPPWPGNILNLHKKWEILCTSSLKLHCTCFGQRWFVRNSNFRRTVFALSNTQEPNQQDKEVAQEGEDCSGDDKDVYGFEAEKQQGVDIDAFEADFVAPAPWSPTSQEEESFGDSSWQSLPVKVMVFIDGTWLYYSFYGRGDRCTIRQKFGAGWQFRYQVEWHRLPILISRALEEQLKQKQGVRRLVEVTRTTVFSSMRSDTGEDSFRQKMFKRMQQSNFEVHLMITAGLQEKCVDIACAVEMLHYATVPGAYDVAVMVTGDKDFSPALVRTRHKGKRVAIASMRNGCNQALVDPSSHVRDFNIIWMDDMLENLLVPILYVPPAVTKALQADLPTKFYLEAVIEMMQDNGGKISSRELGRNLQQISLDEVDALSKLKLVFGSLRNFLVVHNDLFVLNSNYPGLDTKEFIVEFKQTPVAEEKKAGVLIDAYAVDDSDDEQEGEETAQQERESRIVERLAEVKVADLKEMLRKRSLATHGKKMELVQRLIPDLLKEYEEKGHILRTTGEESARQEAVAEAFKSSSNGHLRTITTSTAEPLGRDPSHTITQSTVQPLVNTFLKNAAAAALIKKIKGFVEEKKGIAGSRDMGRFLANESAVDSSLYGSALAELKQTYKSLRFFLVSHPQHFRIEDDREDQFEFKVKLVGPQEPSEARSE